MSQDAATTYYLAAPLPAEASMAGADSDSDSEAGEDILEHSEHLRDAIERLVAPLGAAVEAKVEESTESKEPMIRSAQSSKGAGPVSEVGPQKRSSSLPPDSAGFKSELPCSPRTSAELVGTLREIVAQTGRKSSRSGDGPHRASSGPEVIPRRTHRRTLSSSPVSAPLTARVGDASSRRSSDSFLASLHAEHSRDPFGMSRYPRPVTGASTPRSTSGLGEAVSQRPSGSGPRSTSGLGEAVSQRPSGSGVSKLSSENSQDGPAASGSAEELDIQSIDEETAIGATAAAAAAVAAASIATRVGSRETLSRSSSRDEQTQTSSRDDCGAEDSAIPEESVISSGYPLPRTKASPVVFGGASSMRRDPQEPRQHEQEEDEKTGVDEQADTVPDLPDLDGILWKKKSNLSKTTKVYRLLRREAQQLLSQGDDWFAGLGNIHLAKIKDLASEVIGLIRGEMPPPSANASAKQSESEGGSWDARHVRLYGSELVWSKPVSECYEEFQLIRVGPLYGGSVEYLGMHGKMHGAHAFRLFLPPEVRHHPLTFAAESAVDAELWIASLRKACTVRLPTSPSVRPRWECTADFWHARGPPPEYEPRCAVLHLEILRAAGLSGSGVETTSPEEYGHPCHNAYIVGCLRGHKFRTVTRYSCSGDALFGQQFAIPVQLEDPDDPVHFEVYHEPEFDDQEPLLLGNITVPLFVFGRGQQQKMVLPLRQHDHTRRGVVNASFGRLTIQATLEQPTGHVFLPVEPPLPSDASTSAADPQPTGANLTDLDTQIARIDGLLQMVIGWVVNIAFVLQWERFWVSLAWFTFLQIWALLLWRWSLTIVALLLLKRMYDIKPAARFGKTEDDIVHIEPLSSCHGGAEERADRKPSMHSSATNPSEVASSPLRAPSDHADVPDAIVWEAERRIIFGGFSPIYLMEGIDPPQWTDDKGQECDPPRTAVWEHGVPLRYHWQEVVNERTDENGWQYAFGFGRDSEWCCFFDTMKTWVRVRARHGRRMGRIEVPMESDNPDAQEATDQPRHENMITENDIFRRYQQIYLDIREVIDFWLITLEKHKNLITWKDETVTNVIAALLFIIFVLSFVVPTRLAVSALVVLAFYVGSSMGLRKRQNREIFFEGLSTWCSAQCHTQICLRGSHHCSVIDDHGIPRLALRNWINAKYRVQLDLRSVAGCPTLRELADRVIEASDKFEKVARRYRAWHSDVYTNFIDHVPSDTTENDVGSICYKYLAA